MPSVFSRFSRSNSLQSQRNGRGGDRNSDTSGDRDRDRDRGGGASGDNNPTRARTKFASLPPNSYTPPLSHAVMRASSNSGGGGVGGGPMSSHQPHQQNASRPGSSQTSSSFDFVGNRGSGISGSIFGGSSGGHQQQQQPYQNQDHNHNQPPITALPSTTINNVKGVNHAAGCPNYDVNNVNNNKNLVNKNLIASNETLGLGEPIYLGYDRDASTGLSRTDSVVLQHFWEGKYMENRPRALHLLKFPPFSAQPGYNELQPFCEIYALVKTSPGSKICTLGTATRGAYIGFELFSGSHLHIGVEDAWTNITHHRVYFKSYGDLLKDETVSALIRTWPKPVTIEFLEDTYQGWLLDWDGICWESIEVSDLGLDAEEGSGSVVNLQELAKYPSDHNIHNIRNSINIHQGN